MKKKKKKEKKKWTDSDRIEVYTVKCVSTFIFFFCVMTKGFGDPLIPTFSLTVK